MQTGCLALKPHVRSRIVWPSTQNVCPPLYNVLQLAVTASDKQVYLLHTCIHCSIPDTHPISA